MQKTLPRSIALLVFFLALPVVACFWLSILLWKVRRKRVLEGIAYTLILGGAIGNLIDRFLLGYVVDFLEASGEKRISLLGGEPTIHPKFVDFVKYLNSIIWRISLYSLYQGKRYKSSSGISLQISPRQLFMGIRRNAGKSLVIFSNNSFTALWNSSGRLSLRGKWLEAS